MATSRLSRMTALDPKPSQPPLDSGRSTEGKRTINRLGESGRRGGGTAQRSRTVMHMTSASWSRITRREDNPTMGSLSSAMARGMSLCPDNELNRHSGRFNGHCLGLYRHSAIEPTPVSANSKSCGTARRVALVRTLLAIFHHFPCRFFARQRPFSLRCERACSPLTGATGKDYIDVGFRPRLPSISTEKMGNAAPAVTFKFIRKCPEGQARTKND